MKTLPKTYFENRLEQAQIKSAITAAIPIGVKYENLLKAMAELMTRYIYDAYKEEDKEDTE